MLAFEIGRDGGVEISGTVENLCDLIGWVIVAIKTGHASPTYVSDETLAEVQITCVREQGA
jgi:hypothetical protein